MKHLEIRKGLPARMITGSTGKDEKVWGHGGKGVSL